MTNPLDPEHLSLAMFDPFAPSSSAGPMTALVVASAALVPATVAIADELRPTPVGWPSESLRVSSLPPANLPDRFKIRDYVYHRSSSDQPWNEI